MSKINKMAEVKFILDNMNKSDFGPRLKKSETTLEIPKVTIELQNIETTNLDAMAANPERKRIVKKKGKAIVFRIDI